MDTATLTRPGADETVPPAPASPRRRRGRPGAGWGARRDLHRPALVALLVATFLLRLWGIKQGLPYSYNGDEATHFVPRAIGFFSHDLDPHYFLNPPAYSYLLHVVFEGWFGSGDAVTRAYVTDPTEVFVVGRLCPTSAWSRVEPDVHRRVVASSWWRLFRATSTTTNILAATTLQD